MEAAQAAATDSPTDAPFWRGGHAKKKQTTQTKKNKNMSTEVYFEDIQRRLIERIAAARATICLAMAWLTDAQLWAALLAAQKRGVLVRVLIAKDDINTHSGIDYQGLTRSGGKFGMVDMSHIGTYTKMHHKFCVIDTEICISGSYNWTNQAQRNAEDVLIVQDAQIAQHYARKFEQLASGSIDLQQTDADLLAFAKPYDAQITRLQPTALLVLIDQSGSMSGGSSLIDGVQRNKAEAAAYYLNSLLDELIGKCTKHDGLRDYIDICVLGYGKSSHKAAPVWTGALAAETWVTIRQLDAHADKETIAISKKIRGVEQTQSITRRKWFEPVAENATPMGDALQQAAALLRQWVAQHPDSFPPIVINISDGESTDLRGSALLDAATALKNIHTSAGRVLLFNCHLGDDAGSACRFPRDKSELPADKHAQEMLEMSSLLPLIFNGSIASVMGIAIEPSERRYAMLFNANSQDIAKMLQIGTSQAQALQQI